MDSYDNNKNSKIILVTYNENNYQFASELIKPINIFYNEICSYLQINPNQFILYYDKQKITTNNNNQQLGNIIKNNQNPFFKIMPKIINIPKEIILMQRNNFNSPKKDSHFNLRKKIYNQLTVSMQENKLNIYIIFNMNNTVHQKRIIIITMQMLA